MSSRKGRMRYFTEEPEYESLENGRKQQSLGFQAILGENWPVLASTIVGLLCCSGVIIFTSWLSHQKLVCPSWAIDCNVHPVANWVVNNLALGQGITTIFYVIGLVLLAYAVQHISETAIWPLHSKQPLSLEQIDTYLMIVRGAIPPQKALFQMLKSSHASLFIASTVITTLIPFAAAPILGASWARSNVLQQQQSSYKVGGGIGRLYAQTNPPVSVGAESLSAYISWSRGLSEEPLPEVRNFIIDRSILKDVGSLTARAVRAKTDIVCYPFELMELQSPGPDTAAFATRMSTRNSPVRRLNSSENAQVRIADTMAVWMDDFEFVHANRSWSRLIFAAFNGTIQTGIHSHLSRAVSEDDTTITSIACEVDVEYIDDIVVIGGGGPPDVPLVTLSSIAGIHISFANSTTDKSQNTLNENALWFAAAPLVVCPTVDGKQPMYYRDTDSNSTLPTGYTKAPFQTYEGGKPDNDWTIAEIIEFINVTIGATAIASSQNFRTDHPNPVILTSLIQARRLDPRKVAILAVPVIIILLVEIVLMWRDIALHKEEGITTMRMGQMRDILAHIRPMSMMGVARSSSGRSSIISSRKRPISQVSSIKGVEIKLDRLSEDSEGNYEPVRDVGSMIGRSREDFNAMREMVQSPPEMDQKEIERTYDAAAALLKPEPYERQTSGVASPRQSYSQMETHAHSGGGGVERFHSLHPAHHLHEPS